METISSKDIGVLPDVTIAEELNRLPGLNTTTDRGNASQAALRGGGPRLVLGLVDGREIASSEPDRNVRWELFPSEAVGGVSVYKTQSADMIAGGVMGTIDIQQLMPLDYNGPALTVRAGPVDYEGSSCPTTDGWATAARSRSSTSSATPWAWRSAPATRTRRTASNSFQGWGYETAYTGTQQMLNGAPVNTPWGAQTEADELTEDRAGFTSALQWKPSGEFEMSLDALYSDVRIDENQFQQWYGRNDGLTNDEIPADATVDQRHGRGRDCALLLGDERHRPLRREQDPARHGLNAKWRGRRLEDHGGPLLFPGEPGGHLAGDLRGGLSGDDDVQHLGGPRADRHDQQRPVGPERSRSLPSYSTNDTGYEPGESSPEQLNDALAAARLDFERDLHGDFFTQFDFGARASDRIKSHSEQIYYEDALIPSLPANMLSEFNASGFTVPPLLYGNFNQLAKIAYGGFKMSNPNIAWSSGYPGDPGGRRAVLAGVLLARARRRCRSLRQDGLRPRLGGIPMNGQRRPAGWSTSGRRATATSRSTTAPYTPSPTDHHTTDILPSLNLNFSLTHDLKLRVGLARVMARPPLDEMRAERQIASPDHAAAHRHRAAIRSSIRSCAYQVDTSLEWYFHPESLLAASAYYKDVETQHRLQESSPRTSTATTI